VLRYNPRSTAALHNIALSYNDAKDFPTAEKYLRRAIAEGHQFPLAYETLEMVCLQQGKIDEAIELAQKSMEIRDAAPESWGLASPNSKIMLGAFLAQRGRYADARRWLESARKDRPNDVNVTRMLEELDRRTTTQPAGGK
jgi:tetratricopeptide (TPR) repeat protein